MNNLCYMSATILCCLRVTGGSDDLQTHLMMILILSKEKRDRTLVDVMVLLDCVVNMMVVVCVASAYPVRIFGTAWACVPINIYRTFTLVLNR